MVIIFVRTIFIYISLITTMRLMGKRQIGELEVTDLVTTFLLSEIAALPITDQSIPLVYAIIPMITLLTLEVLSSFILVRMPRLKSLLSARPTILLFRGELDQQALLETRISLDELLSEIRQQGLTSLEQVDCAILEKDGRLTVLPKPQYQPPSAKELGISPTEEPLMHVVYVGKTFNDIGLRLIGRDRAWLEQQFLSKRIEKRKLFCAMANESGELYWIYRSNGRQA